MDGPAGAGPGHEGTHGRQLVEAGEELIQQLHELLGAAGRRQLGEAHDVREQDAAGEAVLRSGSSQAPDTSAPAPSARQPGPQGSRSLLKPQSSETLAL